MATDVFILSNAVIDFRSNDLSFVETLCENGGLAKCKTENMPAYTERQYRSWIKNGSATMGGSGNCAPLIARAGLKVAVGVNLGKGDCNGLDVRGRFFFDTMQANGVDMSAAFIHPSLSTGVTFIYEKGESERGGLVYFPNANNDLDFEYYKNQVERLRPLIVYYMYSGLSERGDANDGKDLSEFMQWCRKREIITIADSHTLANDPQKLIESCEAVAEYKLLEPLLSELDLFFTSYDEARMIENTIGRCFGEFRQKTQDVCISNFLDSLASRFWTDECRTRMFGVTVRDGAFEKHMTADGKTFSPAKIKSRFICGEVVDLVGAGDSFRAGLITYIAKNIEQFKAGTVDFTKAVQMGNLFASLYIKAPIMDRYRNIHSYEKLLHIIEEKQEYNSFCELVSQIKQA